MGLDHIMNTFTSYWAWYKQRVKRCIREEKLPSDFLVRHLDWRHAEYCEGPHVIIAPSWCKCMIPEHLVDHLPHKVKVSYQKTPSHPLRTWAPNCQEIWCETQVGLRDRDWLYLGQHMWAFRSSEHACEFQLTWS